VGSGAEQTPLDFQGCLELVGNAVPALDVLEERQNSFESGFVRVLSNRL
jgi:hypothetical protein